MTGEMTFFVCAEPLPHGHNVKCIQDKPNEFNYLQSLGTIMEKTLKSSYKKILMNKYSQDHSNPNQWGV